MRFAVMLALLVGGISAIGCVSRDRHDATLTSSAAETGTTPDHASLHPSFDPDAPCACAAAIREHGWCRACNVGYVAGERVESAQLFETLDPHGHSLNPALIGCDACQTAMDGDGFCDQCGRGYVAGLTYFTPLTWSVAHGQTVDVGQLKCRTCRSYAREPGWCGRCNRGMVGNVMFVDRGLFNRGQGEYQILLAALNKVATCELCACAMVVHRTCPVCLVSYD